MGGQAVTGTGMNIGRLRTQVAGLGAALQSEEKASKFFG